MLLQQQLSSPTIIYHTSYNSLSTKINFWNSSYQCGSDYINSKDAKGKSLLKQFRCEEAEDYQYRKDVTKPRNHVGNILNKMNGYVFRNPPSRSETNPKYLEFVDQATLSGESLDKVMKKALLISQIEGKTYLVADNTNTKAEVKTLAQARQEGTRPFIRLVHRQSVLNWIENDGFLVECTILYQDQNGKKFLRYYNDQIVQDFIIGEADSITETKPAVEHNYKYIPVVECRPDFSTESQAESISELQQELTHWLSLLAVEGTRNVYTMHAFTGVLPPDNTDETKGSNRPKFTTGTNSIVYLGESGSLERIGAETSAATTLMETIQKVEEAIYRQAGIAAGNPLATQQPQSGLSKIFDQKDLASVLVTLADAAEYAENQIVKVIFESESNFTPAYAFYDKQFELTSYEDELAEIESTLSLQIPNILKRKSIDELSQSYFSLDDNEQKQYEQQLLTLYPDTQETSESSDINEGVEETSVTPDEETEDEQPEVTPTE